MERNSALATKGNAATAAATAETAMTGYLTHGWSLSNVAELSPSRICPNLPLQLRYTYQPMPAAAAIGITTAKRMAKPEVRCFFSNSSSWPSQAYSVDVLSNSLPPLHVDRGTLR